MERDRGNIEDMLRAAMRIRDKTRGQSQESFAADEDMQDIVFRQLGIIGEAANNVTEDFQDTHAEIPWRRIIAVRHRIVHEYSQVDLSRVWRIVEHEIPSLIRQLEKLL